jgi:multicomponent Na+:H+ antiporter subunit F
VALDLLAVLVVGTLTVVAIDSDQPALIDVALALALVAFLATIAFARFIEERRQEDERE